MKKISIALTIAVGTLFAIPLSAQTPQTGDQTAPVSKAVSSENIPNPFKNPKRIAQKTNAVGECLAGEARCVAESENIQKRGECKKRQHGCKDKKQRCRKNPFEGIELTSSQREKIDKVNASQKSKREKMAKKFTEERQKLRESYVKNLRKILTPEQMARYEDNIRTSQSMKTEVTKEEKGYVKPGPVVAAPLPQLDYNSK